MDPDTAHPTLEVSDDGKAVSLSEKPLEVVPSPKRFTQTTMVLAHQSFDAGKYYWEVIVQEKSDWSVGIAKKSMPRNESNNLTNSPLAWSVSFQQRQYLAWHNSISTSLDITTLHRLGLFLDYDAGQLAFYDASTMNPVHTFSETFNEPVFPAFNPGKSADKTKKAILILSDGEARS
ncbi:nuclear factor 7, ovary-like [Amblyraja radiata]|uniref:nuclear factor 7, ovary-like n=1 Tax=Amblyraja radiata TaxID=386614 RepID=UPI0014024EBA|nr:nuclear factor 7, ovary-like [Amblyraja radiata]